MAIRAASAGLVDVAATLMTSVSPTALADTGGATPSFSRTTARTGSLLSTWISVSTARAGSLRAPVLALKSASVLRGCNNTVALPW